jgi:hypothetical protein
LGVGTDTSVTDDSNAETGSESGESATETSSQMLVALVVRVFGHDVSLGNSFLDYTQTRQRIVLLVFHAVIDMIYLSFFKSKLNPHRHPLFELKSDVDS